jgi:hypothetical protein
VIVYAALAVLLIFASFGRRPFETVCFMAIAGINLNLLGMDPPDFLIAPLLLIGIARHFIRMRPVMPSPLVLFSILFLACHTLSDITGDPPANALGHFSLNCVFFVFLVLFLDSPHRLRILFFGLLGGHYVTSAIAGASLFQLTALPALVPELGGDSLAPERLAQHREQLLRLAHRLLRAPRRAERK